MKLRIFLIMMIFSTPVFAGTSWYVKASCANNGNGTSASCAASPGGAGAWKNFSSITWGGAGVTAGSTLYLIGGETYNETLTVGASGSAGSPITISVYGAGQAIIECGNARTGVRVSQNYITIDGIRGDAVAGDYSYGLKIQNPGANEWVVYSYDSPHDIKITHVEGYGTVTGASDDNRGGILLGNAVYNIEISYNWIHGPAYAYSQRTSRWNATGICVWNAVSGTTYTRVLLHHNKVEYMYNDGIRGSNNASLYNNDVRNCDGTGHSDSLLIQSGSYSKVYNNYVESNDQAIYLDNLSPDTKTNIWIYNNVVIGTYPAGSGGLSHFINLDPEGGSWDTVYIMNNSFYNVGGGAYVIRGNGRGSNAVTNLMIKNNILCSSGMLPVALYSSNTVVDANALDYNLYMASNGSNIVQWINGSQYNLTGFRGLSPAREIHGAYGTPTFTNTSLNAWDLHLVAGDTVAISKGTDLSAYFTTDKDGNTRTGTWDIGAYKYNGPSTIKFPLFPTILPIN